MTSYTKGPWYFKRHKEDYADQILGPDKYSVIATLSTNGSGSREKSGTTETNGRLIAAAPEMLGVLERIVLFDNNQTNKQGKHIGIYHESSCPCDICVVIRKARGEI